MTEIVILEGPDGSGKTTHKSRLLGDMKLQERPRACTSEGGPVDELFQWLEADVTWLEGWDGGVSTWGDGLLYDRYPPFSEFAYGPVCRHTISPGFDGAEYATLLRRLLRLNPIVVWCMPRLESVMFNVQNDDMPQMAGVRENIQAIYCNYRHLMSWWSAAGGRSVTWDYAYDSWEDWAEWLMDLTTLTERKP